MPETKNCTDDPKFNAWMLRDEAARAKASGETIRMTPELALVMAAQLDAVARGNG